MPDAVSTVSPALDRVREIANELARSHPDAKGLVRELFLAFTAIYDDVRGPGADIDVRATEALAPIREVLESMAPGELPARKTVVDFYGPEPLHEAQAIAETLRRVLASEDPEQISILPDWGEFRPIRT